MKRKQVQGSGKDAIRDAPREVMAEGIVKRGKKFSDSNIDFIKRRWTVLRFKMNDAQISRDIAKEMGWKADSVKAVIFRLRENNVIKENLNKRERRGFRGSDIEFIKQRWTELCYMKNDSQIVKEIKREKGWKDSSIWNVLKQLRNNNEIGKNPNRQERRRFSDSDIDFIKQRWTELSSRMSDWQIIEKIESEKGWKAGSIWRVIVRLRKKKEIGKNPNKQEQNEFRESDIAFIKQRWTALSSRMTDNQIMKEIAKEKGWIAGSVKNVIIRLRKNKEIGENPNRQERRGFSESDVAFIKQRWTELSSRMTDNQIMKEIAKENGWIAGSVRFIIEQLHENNEIRENPNRRERRGFSESDVAFIKKRWTALSSRMSDWQIIEEIESEKGWKAGSIWRVLVRLRKKKEIAKNPNNHQKRPRGFFSKMNDHELVEYAKKIIEEGGIEGNELKSVDLGLYQTLCRRNLLSLVFPSPAKQSDSEILAQLKDAVELYLGKG